MSYAVKEIFLTLQGEGAHAGRASVFCRFTGCNLWTGRDQDRASATCRFCDTDFVGMDGTLGGRYATANQLAYRAQTQPSMDGNSVDTQVEQAQFAGNAIHYQASLSFITAQIHTMRLAITGTSS